MAIECAAEFDIIDDRYCFRIRSIQFILCGLTGIKKFQQYTQVIDDGLNGFKIGNPVFVCFDFFESDACSFGIGPEIRV
jgi:hypothetical protein